MCVCVCVREREGQWGGVKLEGKEESVFWVLSLSSNRGQDTDPES